MARYLIETDKPVELHALLTNHGIVPKEKWDKEWASVKASYGEVSTAEGEETR